MFCRDFYYNLRSQCGLFSSGKLAVTLLILFLEFLEYVLQQLECLNVCEHYLTTLLGPEHTGFRITFNLALKFSNAIEAYFLILWSLLEGWRS